MTKYSLILLLLAVLSMPNAQAMAQDDSGKVIQRCVTMRLDTPMPPRIGYGLKRMKQRDIDIGDAPVVVQPVMAGLRGPSLTLLGRDVRLAVTTGQSSPQELWQNSLWNHDQIACAQPSVKTIQQAIARGWYWRGTFDNSVGMTTYEPKIIYRSRAVLSALLVRPYGFTFGGGISAPITTNTTALLDLPDQRQPIRRDMARFSNGGGIERLFASWRHTPLVDTHLAVTAGVLEEMYGGFGAEVLYRPFGSPFWVGMDGWEVWRRDADSTLNMRWTDARSFTAHVRIGYDVPDTRWRISVAGGRYLAGDTGATLAALRVFENGARATASLTWTDRREDEGFFHDSHLDPMLRVVWPLGTSGHKETQTSLRQVGRDGGQMLDRPMPLEDMTEAFSAREIIRQWPALLADKKSRPKAAIRFLKVGNKK